MKKRLVLITHDGEKFYEEKGAMRLDVNRAVAEEINYRIQMLKYFKENEGGEVNGVPIDKTFVFVTESERLRLEDILWQYEELMDSLESFIKNSEDKEEAIIMPDIEEATKAHHLLLQMHRIFVDAGFNTNLERDIRDAYDFWIKRFEKVLFHVLVLSGIWGKKMEEVYKDKKYIPDNIWNDLKKYF